MVLSLDAYQISALKRRACCERPYAPRLSTALALQLVYRYETRFEYWAVLDEIDHLEGRRSASRTKPAEQFKKPPLRPFWHKHFSGAGHIAANLRIQCNRADADRVLEQRIPFGIGGPELLARLSHELVIGGYERRTQRGLAGDWIIYAPHEGRNYYLIAARHGSGRKGEDEALYQRLRRQVAAEFPFLFEDR